MRRTDGSRRARLIGAAAILGLLAGCAETQFAVDAAKSGRRSVAAAPGSQSYYKVGAPYKIDGVWYYPEVDYDYDREGVASWYGPGFDGRSTANGETYDQNDLTAAHPTLPLPSMVQVTNLENGRSIAVRLNDRGPFVGGRIIDLSRRSAQMLGIERAGTARVRVRMLEPESRQLAALAQQGIVDVPVLAQGELAPPERGVQLAAVSAAPVKPVRAVAKPVQLAQLQEAAPVIATDASPVSPAPVAAVVSEELPPLPGAAAAAPPQPRAVAPVAVEPVAAPTGGQPIALAPAVEAAPLPSAPAALAAPAPRMVWGSGNMAPIVDGPGVKAPSTGAPTPAAVEAVAAHREDGSAVIVTQEEAQLYVQAGAFSQQKNADAMRTKLAAIGPTLIAPVQVSGKQLFRVRLGPVGSPEEADRLLKQVVSTGQSDARIVVETGS